MTYIQPEIFNEAYKYKDNTVTTTWHKRVKKIVIK
jgi:hypothetical protein